MTHSGPERTSAARRGRLTVYLGAAPGVGKTYAMLDEAHRRLARGTDVVVGLVETHGRPLTISKLEGLEIVPRQEIMHRGGAFTEMDTDAVIARHPDVVLVDELAHTNVPGSRHAKRVEDVEQIRAAGIDVITTVNIQHLESLNDEVERITGVRQRETVPDEAVRAADQIQLVDMSPQALRRRMAHGNVYRAEQVDAALTSYFRVGNLTALRELALLWLADRVDDALDEYRRSHGIDEQWPTKERIVVAVTGGAESETLVRRGARLAQRAAGSELMTLHVTTTDGLRSSGGSALAAVEQMTESLGGTFHSAVGEEVPVAVVDFARAVNATMIVVGVSRHSSLRRLFTGSTVDRIADLAGAIDVHLVTHEEVLAGTRRSAAPLSPLSPRRRLAGWLCAVVLPVVLTLVLRAMHDDESLPLEVLLFLAVAVLVALVGGMLPALVAAVGGFLLLNWFFTDPVGRFTIAEPANLVALLVYVGVAVGVASVVDRASRRGQEAARARAEAATLASLSRSVLTGQDTAQAIVDRLRESFGLRAVSLLEERPEGYVVLASAGDDPARSPDAADARVAVDDVHLLALSGAPLQAADQRVLEGFAVQTGVVLEHRRLRERETRAALLERADATSTALLRAVSHDLRTPLATTRAAVDVLAKGPEDLDPEDRSELVRTATSSVDQLEHLIDNLLDLSRVQSGLVHPRLQPHSLEEILPLAVAGHSSDDVVLELDEQAPLVVTDAGLLERVVANLVDNAVRHSPGVPVRVIAQELPAEIAILVVDRGPGVPVEERERMFEPFQRLGDTGPEGLGLGLAVAKGLADAIGATLAAEDTPNGGLTMVVSVPQVPLAGEPT